VIPDCRWPTSRSTPPCRWPTQAARNYKAALERVSAAESTRRAIVGEGLPSVRVDANYGDIGFTPSDSRATFAVTGAVNVPIFNGGRTRGRLLEADADLRSRRAEAEDLKSSIYYEVRTAFLDLDATATQLALSARRAISPTSS